MALKDKGYAKLELKTAEADKKLFKVGEIALLRIPPNAATIRAHVWLGV